MEALWRVCNMPRRVKRWLKASDGLCLAGSAELEALIKDRFISPLFLLKGTELIHASNREWCLPNVVYRVCEQYCSRPLQRPVEAFDLTLGKLISGECKQPKSSSIAGLGTSLNVWGSKYSLRIMGWAHIVVVERLYVEGPLKLKCQPNTRSLWSDRIIRWIFNGFEGFRWKIKCLIRTSNKAARTQIGGYKLWQIFTFFFGL